MTVRSCFLAEAAAGSAAHALTATMSAATVRRGQVSDMRASLAGAPGSGRDRLERLGAERGMHRISEQCVLGRAELGILVEHGPGAHARTLEQLGVLRQTCDLELREPGLA